ncbi:unnamed protein product, partial [Iphiclides podalirius]
MSYGEWPCMIIYNCDAAEYCNGTFPNVALSDAHWGFVCAVSLRAVVEVIKAAFGSESAPHPVSARNGRLVCRGANGHAPPLPPGDAAFAANALKRHPSWTP